MSIGTRIKELRLTLGMTQDDLAAKIGTTKQAIYKYECGIVTNIPLDRLELIAKALGVTASYLMGWEDETKQAPEPTDEEKLKVALFGGDSEVTDDMWDEVKNFAEFVKQKKKGGK